MKSIKLFIVKNQSFIVIGICLITCISLFIKLHYDRCRIDQLLELQSLSIIISKTDLPTASKIIAERDSLLRLVYSQKIKEEYYTTQISLQSDWIVLFTGSLFLCFTILNVGYFIHEIKEVKSEQNKIKEDQNVHKKSVEDYIKKVGFATLKDIKNVDYDRRKDFATLARLMGNMGYMSNQILPSFYYSAMALNIGKDLSDEDLEEFLNTCLLNLKNCLNDIIKSTEDFQYRNEFYSIAINLDLRSILYKIANKTVETISHDLIDEVNNLYSEIMKGVKSS